jgi:hypothetical protein
MESTNQPIDIGFLLNLMEKLTIWVLEWIILLEDDGVKYLHAPWVRQAKKAILLICLVCRSLSKIILLHLSALLGVLHIFLKHLGDVWEWVNLENALCDTFQVSSFKKSMRFCYESNAD